MADSGITQVSDLRELINATAPIAGNLHEHLNNALPNRIVKVKITRSWSKFTNLSISER